MSACLQALHDEFRFDRLYITAHSMGGLVSRGAILSDWWEEPPGYIRLLVCLSTPWGGVRLARQGVKKAPIAVPSWHDVAPDSPFLHSIFERSLSPKIPFYLFFSYRGNCNPFMANNDRAVELSSQLAYRAQSDAVAVYGFDEDHTGILESDAMIKRYLDLLAAAGGR